MDWMLVDTGKPPISLHMVHTFRQARDFKLGVFIAPTREALAAKSASVNFGLREDSPILKLGKSSLVTRKSVQSANVTFLISGITFSNFFSPLTSPNPRHSSLLLAATNRIIETSL
jgi:hypothetical protein